MQVLFEQIVPAPQSLFDKHWTHVNVDVSHTGVVPLHVGHVSSTTSPPPSAGFDTSFPLSDWLVPSRPLSQSWRQFARVPPESALWLQEEARESAPAKPRSAHAQVAIRYGCTCYLERGLFRVPKIAKH